jgi:hypothetical protein
VKLWKYFTTHHSIETRLKDRSYGEWNSGVPTYAIVALAALTEILHNYPDEVAPLVNFEMVANLLNDDLTRELSYMDLSIIINVLACLIDIQRFSKEISLTQHATKFITVSERYHYWRLYWSVAAICDRISNIV